MTHQYPALFHRIGSIAAQLCVLAVVPAWAQFETRATSSLPFGAFSIATGDFNRDGKMDIAVVCDGGFTVALGNGDGTFQKATFYPTALAYSLAVADFNNDGKLDVVVANLNLNPSTVSVYLGNGDGTFQAATDSNTTAGSYFVAVGDFNHDKIPDLVIIDPPYVSVLLGHGDGTFGAPSDNSSFVGAHELAVGDFNNDHRLDVAVVGYFGGSQDMGILLGNGDGTLQSSLTYPLTYTPGSVAAGDFNRDGNLDLAIGAYFGNGVTVLLGNGDGSFQPARTYLGGGGDVIVGDFNQDGKLDLVAGATSVQGVTEFLGKGDGTFMPAQVFASGNSGLQAGGDLNGDHMRDLVLANATFGAISMLNTGALSFSPSSPLNFAVQVVNTKSSPLSVTLTNTGAKAISISSMQVSGQFLTDSGTTCQTSVGVGASCTISIQFAPKSAGSHSGLITLVDGASSKPQVTELSGRSTSLSISPASLNFGSQKVGTKSPVQQLKVTNVSNMAVDFSGIGIGGHNYLDFSETNTCGTQLAAGATCTVGVVFAPTQTGSRNGDVYFTVTPKNNSPAFVVLSGTGT